MIRKLQRRFILITMVSVISIFILILAVLNISVSYSAMQHGYATLQDYAMRDTADGIKALDTPDNIQISNPQKNPVHSPLFLPRISPMDIHRIRIRFGVIEPMDIT